MVVRDDRLPRAVRGTYVYADYCSGFVRHFRPTRSGSRNDGSLGVGEVSRVVGFGTDSRDRVYVAQLTGTVSRLDPR